MAQYSKKIELYAIANGVNSIDFRNDVILENDNIKTWNLEISQPTAEQIASYETAANAAEANAAIDATRQTQYLSWQQQMEMIYKDQKNGTTTFKDHCDKVRSDNPK